MQSQTKTTLTIITWILAIMAILLLGYGIWRLFI